jgi:hypothetical protein
MASSDWIQPHPRSNRLSPEDYVRNSLYLPGRFLHNHAIISLLEHIRDT